MNQHVQNAINGIAATVRKMQGQHQTIMAQYKLIEKMCVSQRSITAEIDAIPGRRIYYTLVGRIPFDIADNGRAGQPINMLVSQDGPLVQTHYPLASWLPSLPTTATMFGLWRPVTPWPLPDQFVNGAVDGDSDIISISYSVLDAGSQRNFQNQPVPPLLSRPDLLQPLPVPTLFTPNTTITITPFYEQILFNNGGVPPTQGVLVFALPSYRIVNL